jgi:chorismate dehydratase
MSARKHLGIPSHLYCDPLRGAPGSRIPFTVTTDASARLAHALRERKVDLALLAPIDYARDGSLFHIVPDVAVASSVATGTVTIHFRSELRQIRSLAVDPASPSEIILAQVILSEQFGVRPAVVPTDGSLEQGLVKADATLLVGDASLRVREKALQSIDLVEEWFEMTDLPYVHGLWCGKERSAGETEFASLAHLRDAGVAAIPAIASAGCAAHALPSLDTEEIQEVLEGFQYELTEEVEDGLKEFLRFAFYHGILPDVAEVQYFGPSEPEEDAETPSRSVH